MKTKQKMVMEKDFVIFYSPGTLVAETTICPIDSWNLDVAIQMSRKIRERHGARPYGFCFITKRRTDEELDSREIKRSCMYYLGGSVLTLREVRARKDPRDKVLISNMECNGYDRVVQNDNSYRWTMPLKEGDVVLAYTP